MPVLAAREAKRVRAAARDGRRLHVRHFDGVTAVRGRTPAEQPIALKHCEHLFIYYLLAPHLRACLT